MRFLSRLLKRRRGEHGSEPIVVTIRKEGEENEIRRWDKEVDERSVNELVMLVDQLEQAAVRYGAFIVVSPEYLPKMAEDCGVDLEEVQHQRQRYEALTERIREIGQDLNKSGGTGLMAAVARQVDREYSSAGSVLSGTWSGIGAWRA